MFGEIAHRYDLLNRVLSLGFDRGWRRELVAAVSTGAPRRVLDVATGTADLAIALKRQLPGSEVIGVDVSDPMLDIGRLKVERSGLEVELDWADGMDLAFPDQSFDAVTIAYGLRNFSDRRRGLAEFRRVLRPAGRLAVLEFPPLPSHGLGRLLRLYCFGVVPFVGGLISGRGSAYRYLPSSVETFPPPPELRRMMSEVGFVNVSSRLQTFGISALHLGDNPP